MKSQASEFVVTEGSEVNLKKSPTLVSPLYSSKDDYERILDKHTEKLSKLQNVLYADDRYALLVIFQAMDAAGKDSAIEHVMSGVNPQGITCSMAYLPLATRSPPRPGFPSLQPRR